MCDWRGGPNEIANYAVSMDKVSASKKEMDDRGYAHDEEGYIYIGHVNASLIDNGTMVWMCKRDGAVVAHQGLHERSFHE